jgi:hypothetical protein
MTPELARQNIALPSVCCAAFQAVELFCSFCLTGFGNFVQIALLCKPAWACPNSIQRIDQSRHQSGEWGVGRVIVNRVDVTVFRFAFPEARVLGRFTARTLLENKNFKPSAAVAHERPSPN